MSHEINCPFPYEPCGCGDKASAPSPEELAREIIVDFGRAPAKTALFNLHVSKLSALLRRGLGE